MNLSSLPTEIQANIFAHLNPALENHITPDFPRTYTLSPISRTNRSFHAAYVTWYYGLTTITLESIPLDPDHPPSSSTKSPHWTSPNATPLSAFLANASPLLTSAVRRLRISAHASELLWLFAPDAAIRILRLPVAEFPHWKKMRETVRNMRVSVLEVEFLRPGGLDWTRNNHPLHSRLWPDARWVLKALEEAGLRGGGVAREIVFRPVGMDVEHDLAYPTFPPEDFDFLGAGRKGWSWEMMASSQDSAVRHVCFSEGRDGGKGVGCGNVKHVWYLPAVKGQVNQPFEEGEWMFGDGVWKQFRSRVRPESEYLDGLHGTFMEKLL